VNEVVQMFKSPTRNLQEEANDIKVVVEEITHAVVGAVHTAEHFIMDTAEQVVVEGAQRTLNESAMAFIEDGRAHFAADDAHTVETANVLSPLNCARDPRTLQDSAIKAQKPMVSFRLPTRTTVRGASIADTCTATTREQASQFGRSARQAVQDAKHAVQDAFGLDPRKQKDTEFKMTPCQILQALEHIQEMEGERAPGHVESLTTEEMQLEAEFLAQKDSRLQQAREELERQGAERKAPLDARSARVVQGDQLATARGLKHPERTTQGYRPSNRDDGGGSSFEFDLDCAGDTCSVSSSGSSGSVRTLSVDGPEANITPCRSAPMLPPGACESIAPRSPVPEAASRRGNRNVSTCKQKRANRNERCLNGGQRREPPPTCGGGMVQVKATPCGRFPLDVDHDGDESSSSGGSSYRLSNSSSLSDCLRHDSPRPAVGGADEPTTISGAPRTEPPRAATSARPLAAHPLATKPAHIMVQIDSEWVG